MSCIALHAQGVQAHRSAINGSGESATCSRALSVAACAAVQ